MDLGLKNFELIAKDRGHLHDTTASVSACSEGSLVTECVCAQQGRAALWIS